MENLMDGKDYDVIVDRSTYLKGSMYLWAKACWMTAFYIYSCFVCGWFFVFLFFFDALNVFFCSNLLFHNSIANAAVKQEIPKTEPFLLLFLACVPK